MVDVWNAFFFTGSNKHIPISGVYSVPMDKAFDNVDGKINSPREIATCWPLVNDIPHRCDIIVHVIHGTIRIAFCQELYREI